MKSGQSKVVFTVMSFFQMKKPNTTKQSGIQTKADIKRIVDDAFDKTGPFLLNS